jgi:hypothetical protein
MPYQSISAQDAQRLARIHVPDTALNVQTRYFLQSGLAKAFVSGDLEHPLAIIVQSFTCPEEPVVIGNNVQAIWDLLPSIDKFECLLVDDYEVANQLAEKFLERGQSVRFYEDWVYVCESLKEPSKKPKNVRFLNFPDDQNLLDQVPEYFEINAQNNVAVAIENGRIVSFSHIFAETENFVDVGTHTDETMGLDNGQEKRKYWGKGYSTYTAYLVAQKALARNKTPVWSTGQNNLASQAVSRKLGFVEKPELRRPYVIV